jgi:hypothetical protein
VSADGFVTREQWVGWQTGPRAGVTLDLIRNSAPFSMEFYRQLVRGTYDQERAHGRPFEGEAGYHAAIVYQRPRGNTDPDNDPSSGRMFSPGDVDGPRERVRN